MRRALRGERMQRILSAALFGAFALWSVWMLIVHEPWRDEVQSWLLARDLRFGELLAQLRYDGHPIGWFLFLWPMAQLGLPFVAERVLHTLMVLCVAALLCFGTKSLRLKLFVLLATPLFYEMTALSRNYALAALALTVMALCHSERFGRRMPVYAVALFFLINANSYGTILGIALLGSEVLLWLAEIARREQPAYPFRRRVVYAAVSVLSIACACAVMFSPLFLPLNPVPLVEGAHFHIIQSYGMSADRLADAFRRLGNVLVLGALPADIRQFLSGPLASLTGLSATVWEMLGAVACNGVILLALTGAVMLARERRTKLFIAGAGLAGYAGTLLAIALSGIFNIRHGIPLLFLLVYFWILALQERPAAPKALSPGLRVAALCLAAAVFAGAFGLNVYRAYRDIREPYSMGERTAAFLKDNGYDSADTLILATNHPQVTTVLGLLDEVQTLRFVYGDHSFALWQVYNSRYEHSFSLPAFLAQEAEREAENYEHILFLAMRGTDSFGWPVLYDSGGGSIMPDECYVICTVK